MGTRRFELAEKFWEVERAGSVLTTRSGTIGAEGQSKTVDWKAESRAEAAEKKQVALRTRKGYREVDEASEAPPPVAVQQSEPCFPDAPMDLADGEVWQVPGSGSNVYTITNTAGAYACTCPAWRHQREYTGRRTCKHIRRLRGEEAETARLGALPARALRSSAAKEDAPALLLAHKWDERDPTGWWMSEKLDGVRAYWDGSRFLSRLGNEFTAPKWFTEMLPGTPLDGELFGGRGEFQITVGLVKSGPRDAAWQRLRYLIFDAPTHDGHFEERVAHIEQMAADWEHASALAHELCRGAQHLAEELARVEGLGGEGLMLRKPLSRYVHGRSEVLLKVKSFHDAEARVVGHQAGKGKNEGRLGALKVQLPDGTRFKVGTGFSDAEREDPPAAGAVITFRYQELTKAGVPRFPTYIGVRDDFDWEAAVAAAKQ